MILKYVDCAFSLHVLAISIDTWLILDDPGISWRCLFDCMQCIVVEQCLWMSDDVCIILYLIVIFM